ncbi:MAG: hypothetical protein EZS28_029691 [Streblomastix strix]|uniref:Uncharacterized protein n=1 Tax=Streblomastix strix TaxID=222440 RepID=A0A5J4UXG5_9EUKA|nr:MAG: hypothetical protein EZS28_029691 [Streblomastix strix]
MITREEYPQFLQSDCKLEHHLRRLRCHKELGRLRMRYLASKRLQLDESLHLRQIVKKPKPQQRKKAEEEEIGIVMKANMKIPSHQEEEVSL